MPAYHADSRIVYNCFLVDVDDPLNEIPSRMENMQVQIAYRKDKVELHSKLSFLDGKEE
jgi:hypothetical protein